MALLNTTATLLLYLCPINHSLADQHVPLSCFGTEMTSKPPATFLQPELVNEDLDMKAPEKSKSELQTGTGKGANVLGSEATTNTYTP